jgi:hypothetical protein
MVEKNQRENLVALFLHYVQKIFLLAIFSLLSVAYDHSKKVSRDHTDKEIKHFVL